MEQTLVIYNISSTSVKTKYILKYIHDIHLRKIIKELKLSFVSEKSGDYELCIMNYDYVVIEVNFSMKYGLGAKDYSSVARKKDLKDTELILEKIEDRAKDVGNIVKFEKNKYLKIENILDQLCNTTMLSSISIVIIMVIVGILEIIFLKKYMKKRKLI